MLATCALLGVDEVYAVGGAQAVAMFAYGAEGSDDVDGAILCEPVDVITGPGNVYVAAAKRLVRGVVGIDAEAGPTEIAILADGTADADARRRGPGLAGRARPARGRRPGHAVGRARGLRSRPSSSTGWRRRSTAAGSRPR